MSGRSPGRVAWVTGAGKGIGHELARRLAGEGWVVAVSARTESDLVSLAAECAPARIVAIPLDVTDLAATARTVSEIERQCGPIDLAILNAGMHTPMGASDFSVETVTNLMDTNLMGTVNGLSQLLPRFIERKKGHVAVVASLAGYRGLPGAAAYGASKAALINMCEALRPELEGHGVRLTLINPGFVDTPLTRRNDFPMPFLIPTDKAVDHIIRGLNGNAFEIAFPRRFAALMKVLRILPDRAFLALTRRMVRDE